jgi:hypothetical protein
MSEPSISPNYESCDTPTEVNPLMRNGFKFAVERIPDITYFCQEANIPEITLQSADMETPYSRIPMTGDKASFSPLVVEFLIDAQFKNYMAMYDWIYEQAFPDYNPQYTRQVQKGRITRAISEAKATTSTAVLGVLGNNNQIIASVRFIDCVLISLSGLNFTTINSDSQFLTGTAVFKYQGYTIHSEYLGNPL